jgi:DNA-binding response OmpR family regulator
VDRFADPFEFMAEKEVCPRHRILVVDDDDGVRTLLEKLLIECGYIVTAVGLAKECLEKLRESTFDLILLDHGLPDMDGLLLLQLVYSHTGVSQPIIYLTGMADAATKAKAFEIGVDDYVTKPFNPTDLLARVAEQIQLSDERKCRRGK